MASNIKSKFLLFCGILFILMGCSTISFGQAACGTITLPAGSEFTPNEGTRVESISFTVGKMVIKVCSDSATSPQRTLNTECPPVRQPEPPSPEEVRRLKRIADEERRREQAENKRAMGKEPGDSPRDAKMRDQ